MDVDQARSLAEAKLREIEDPATPLALHPEYPPRELDWAWAFPFNSVEFLRSGDFSFMVPSGPVVVNKDGTDVWVAGSAPPVEQWFNRYADEHGYPAVPLPPPVSPF